MKAVLRSVKAATRFDVLAFLSDSDSSNISAVQHLVTENRILCGRNGTSGRYSLATLLEDSVLARESQETMDLMDADGQCGSGH